MPSPIAFVSRMNAETEAVWKQALRAAMPQEDILSFSELTDEQRRAVDFAIVANPDPADIAALPGLTWVHSLWAGVERLVLELGDKAPPIVRLKDPELSRVMAEAVLAWTYYLQRDMPAYRENQQKALWQELDYRHPREMTIGLLGLGALGTAAAERLTHAGFNVAGWSRSAKVIEGVETLTGDAGLQALLEKSDILVCLVPLTDATRGLLDAGRFAAMKQGAALINFARGAVIVADDLIAVLDSGRLSHAVLDVFEQEPLPTASPFWQHPQVTVLPHISAPTSRESSARIVAGNVRAWRETGRLPETVDMIRGY
ncbi:MULTISPECIES: 2-hydroxyacid dehydrogenase [Agrobacterium tumefaciens complex]|uniref:2-hydroxyacid dehydrogenase n=1 Tax=Agrobacterium tumefaciens complex TaxID=1183400 RepID=UPI0009BA1B86|nr:MULTISPECIES: glyoxylate/hydroxypyruvate reductase A [Agrobacterium tumefaciens complex]MBB4408853.1 glyoxylate/hydroxypyruvate reductase A [Agrobacterium radiobacter]MBB4454571.1 glyoxylate/hydroxypyruvate reductase A [Agrobacterium radiobacter]MBP2541889.1 glyoxylate/hydroxypyruvate reductase A [Agrobacterium tumefaciens]WQE42442.1 glyoxylate/hydroxypyruvate reductase A [Agrobacterium tumefaciens]CUX40413.1 2-hydroxyacid dehydrogenase [Agrobacterium tumefaciens str. CFBP 5621]